MFLVGGSSKYDLAIFDNTTVNQETPLKLQSIRQTRTYRNACKKNF